MKEVFEIVKELRKERGLTQAQVANHLKMERTGYNRYENGIFEFNNDMLRKLARFFKVTSDYLLNLVEE